MTKKEATKLTDEMTKLTLTVARMRKMKHVRGPSSSSTGVGGAK